MRKIQLILFLCFVTFLSGQTTFYIKKGATGNGSSWDNALPDLPTAFSVDALEDTRVLNNVRIYIAEGDYNFSTTYGYTGNEVLIQGGFSETSTGTDLSQYNPEMYITRIVKPANKRFVQITTTSNDFDNNKLTVKGLYFKSTGTLTVSGNVINQQGTSAKYIQLKIEDCVFHDSRSGSAMIRLATANSGKVTHWMHNNKFYRNTMGATGGFEYTTVNGDVKVLISNNLFGEGSSLDGTGFYATTAGSSTTSGARFYIIGNIFSCGTAGSTTGGIYLTTAGNTLIRNNVFLGVQGKNYGGAIFATAARGIQIEDNFFIQNSTVNTGVGAGGAIAIEGTVGVGSILTTNHIKGNYFYENKVNTTGSGGSAISFSAGASSISANKYDIIGNVFAYNETRTGQLAVIQTRGNNIRNLSKNVFYGNKNGNDALDPYIELKVTNGNNIESITENTFQLPNAAAYSGNSLIASKISTGQGNTFNSSENDVMGLKPGDLVIDCYSGGVGCFKVDDSEQAVAKISKMGISTFKKQAEGWPSVDNDGNSINNGAMVLESNSKPFMVTRVNNPAKTLGLDPSLKGALAYDTARKCLMLFNGEKWDCLTKGCDVSLYDILENIKK